MSDRATAAEIALAGVLDVINRHPEVRMLRRIPFMPQIHTGAPLATWNRAVVVDTETTGLDTKTDKAIEFGAAEIWYDQSGLQAFGEFKSWLEDPGMPISAEVTKVHGITAEEIAGKSFPDPEIEEFMNGTAIVIAHNADFDRPILERRFPTWAPKLSWACSVKEVPWKEYGCPSSNLQCIAWASGLFFEAHRTRGDVSALACLLGCIRLGTRSPLIDLLNNARKPLFRLWALGTSYDVNEQLKERGYRWRPARKGWFVDILDETKAQDEHAWLRDHILRGREPEWQLIKATDRYSVRAE